MVGEMAWEGDEGLMGLAIRSLVLQPRANRASLSLSTATRRVRVPGQHQLYSLHLHAAARKNGLLRREFLLCHRAGFESFPLAVPHPFNQASGLSLKSPLADYLRKGMSPSPATTSS